MDNKDGQSSLPSQKTAWRKALIEKRQTLADRAWRNDMLQRVMRVWLIDRPDAVIGAYWPIKGEFDPLPALFRWTESDEERCIGLPVINKATKQLSFQMWFPGCEMEEDAYGIPKPKDTPVFHPTLLLVPCVGYGDGGVRLGYGGGFYDRTLATLEPRPYTVGLAYRHGHLPWLKAEPHDVPLDAVLNEDGVAWQRPLPPAETPPAD